VADRPAYHRRAIVGRRRPDTMEAEVMPRAE